MPLALKQVSRLGVGVRAAPLVRPLFLYNQSIPESLQDEMGSFISVGAVFDFDFDSTALRRLDIFEPSTSLELGYDLSTPTSSSTRGVQLLLKAAAFASGYHRSQLRDLSNNSVVSVGFSALPFPTHNASIMTNTAPLLMWVVL